MQFGIAPDSGAPHPDTLSPPGGKKPRFFTLGPRGKHLHVANEDSDDITIFHIDQDAGSLIPTGVRVSVGSPSAISFVPPLERQVSSRRYCFQSKNTLGTTTWPRPPPVQQRPRR